MTSVQTAAGLEDQQAAVILVDLQAASQQVDHKATARPVYKQAAAGLLNQQGAAAAGLVDHQSSILQVGATSNPKTSQTKYLKVDINSPRINKTK